MWSKSVNKTVLIVGLLVLVLAVGIITRTDVGRGYLDWLRASVSKMSPLSSESLIDDNSLSDIDLSDMAFNNTEEEANSDANEISEEAENTDAKPIISETPVLAKIESHVEEINRKAENVKTEIEKLVVLEGIIGQIGEITKETQDITEKANGFDGLSGLEEVQKQMSVVAESADLLNKDIVNSVQKQVNTITEEVKVLNQEILDLA